MKEKKDRRTYMLEAPVEGLVNRMALPAIVSMLISAIYNLVDTKFVGKLSTEAVSAVGVVFSYMALLQAISFFFGHGAGNYISRMLGAGKRKDAESMASTAFFTAIGLGLVLTAVSFCFMEPIATFLGAKPAFMKETKEYMVFVLCGTPFIMGSFILNNFMRFQANALMGMIGIGSGAILNIILDPIFIFGLNLGVAGASLATMLSQMVGFCILLHLCGRRDGIKIRISQYGMNRSRLSEICAGGMPSLCRQGIASVAAIVLNRLAGGYDDSSAIAAFSVVNRISMFTGSLVIGFGQGFQPVCGFNYGAGKYDRVKKALLYSIKVATVYCIVLAVALFANAESIVRWFRKDDARLVVIAAKALRFQAVTFSVTGITVLSNMYLQNIRKTVPATILALARSGLFFIPTAFIMNALFQITGLQLSQSIADLIALLVSIPFLVINLRKMMADFPSSEKTNV